MIINATSIIGPFHQRVMQPIGSKITEIANRILEPTITRIEALLESSPRIMQVLEPTMYTLFKFSNNYPILSQCLFSVVLTITALAQIVLLVTYLPQITSTLAGLIINTLITTYITAYIILAVVLYTLAPFQLEKRFDQTPYITKESAAFFNLDPEFVSRLNTWTNETSQLNENWHVVRKKIIRFYRVNHAWSGELYLDNCQLHSLPDIFDIPVFRNKLQTLDLSNNELTTLPASIRTLQSLTTLDLYNNATLSGLPQEILHLPTTCTVNISSCGFSQAVLERIEETISAQGGPRISHSMEREDSRSDRIPSIKDSLSKLYTMIGSDYKELPNLEEIPSLATWLHKLFWTADYKEDSLKQKFAPIIIEYLERANENASFREMFSATIWNAVNTCGDNIALSVVRLSVTYKLSIIDPKNMQGLNYLLTNGTWALELLREIARQKIQTLRFFDEIEVYLGYPIHLKKALNLPIDVENMIYFPFAGLTSEDLEIATQTVLTTMSNEEEHVTFLIDQPQWIEALKLNYKEQFIVIEKKKEHASSSNNANYAEIGFIQKQDLKELTKQVLSTFPNFLH